ncbi:hypothetical protein [Branchiibius sp. NY16-3462-2]|uniref:hypothetical protein n=1 Tax=Branchiibius sp. NY16-3462-2 TaxID=1807500 RepID=UPI0025BEAA74|nr:hypothetical protein [Branchiibius sp. NY16-3462-2]
MTLAEGPAVVAGLVVAGPLPAALGVATGAAGLLDDLAAGEGSVAKGLRGHLRALGRGEVTTGVVKIAAIGTAALASTAVADRGRRGIVDTLIGGALVAGSANLLNLFDLRPGRALKVAVAGATPLLLVADESAAAILGVAAAAAPADLAGRSMLGDTGANALGAVLGLAWARGLPLAGRVVGATVVAGLILASERVSFTEVIATNPALNAIDRWGRPE